MKEWLEEEELDIEAMSEALLSLFDLIKKFEGCCDKDEEVSKNIQKIQFGHNRVKQLLFGRSENGLEEKKKIHEKDIAILYQIIKLASFQMECYLSTFKQDKIKEYYQTLKTFITDSHKNLEDNNKLWNNISLEVEEKVNSTKIDNNKIIN